MLTIRSNQMTIFEAARFDQIVQSTVERIEKHWPHRVAQWGLNECHSRARLAVESAAGFGFTTESDIQRYVNLTIALGTRFDEDPCHASVRALVRNRELAADVRLDQLVAYTYDYLKNEAL